jgi:hypothetical protein
VDSSGAATVTTKGCLLLLSFLVALFAGARSGHCLDLDSGVYQNASLGLRMPIPSRWRLYRTTGYPSILAILVHEDGSSTLALSTAASRPGQSLAALAAEEAKGLAAVGMTAERIQPRVYFGKKVIEIEARFASGGQKLTLLYHQKGIQIFILTLCAPAGRPEYAQDLQEVLAYLTIGEAESAESVESRAVKSREVETRSRSGSASAPSSAPATAPSPSSKPTRGPAPLPPTGPELPDDLPEL